MLYLFIYRSFVHSSLILTASVKLVCDKKKVDSSYTIPSENHAIELATSWAKILIQMMSSQS